MWFLPLGEQHFNTDPVAEPLGIDHEQQILWPPQFWPQWSEFASSVQGYATR